jgi:hypothetical protein
MIEKGDHTLHACPLALGINESLPGIQAALVNTGVIKVIDLATRLVKLELKHSRKSLAFVRTFEIAVPSIFFLEEVENPHVRALN